MAFADGVWLVVGTSGTADFGNGSPLTGYRDLGVLTNGQVYSYRAQHPSDKSIWELGRGTWNGTVLARTVLASSTGFKIDFGAPPVVLISALASDLVSASDARTANQVFASPNGIAGVPNFRSLVSGDIPVLDASKINSGTFGPTRIDQNATYNWTGPHNYARTGTTNPINFTASSPGNILDTTSGKGAVQFFASTGDAYVAFHIAGSYAAYFGFRQGQQGVWYGGWSEGNAAYQLHDTKGNGQATQAEQEASAGVAKFVAPWSQGYHPSAAKVACAFNGNGALPAFTSNYGASSITDRGTGKWTVNFAVGMSSANYVAVPGVAKNDSTDDANFTVTLGSSTIVPTSTSCPITVGLSNTPGALRDTHWVTLVVYGDL